MPISPSRSRPLRILSGVTRDEVEAALRAIRAVLNRLAAHYWQSEMAYDMVVPYGSDADALVYCLEKGRAGGRPADEASARGKAAA